MKTNGRRAMLVLTGDRQDQRYGITITGHSVELPEALYGGVLELVRAKLSSHEEFVQVSATVVCRLRLELGKVIGVAEAHQLIATGSGSTYALALDKRDIHVSAGFRTSPLSNELLKETRAAILRSEDRRRKHQRK